MGKHVRPNDFAMPTQKDVVFVVRVKYFEKVDPVLLEADVNSFLTAGLGVIGPDYYVESVDFDTFLSTTGPPTMTHCCWVKFVLIGG